MRFAYEAAAAVPSVAAGLAVGEAIDALDASAPWPQLTFILVALLSAAVLDRLIDPFRIYRAARRG